MTFTYYESDTAEGTTALTRVTVTDSSYILVEDIDDYAILSYDITFMADGYESYQVTGSIGGNESGCLNTFEASNTISSTLKFYTGFYKDFEIWCEDPGNVTLVITYMKVGSAYFSGNCYIIENNYIDSTGSFLWSDYDDLADVYQVAAEYGSTINCIIQGEVTAPDGQSKTFSLSKNLTVSNTASNISFNVYCEGSTSYGYSINVQIS